MNLAAPSISKTASQVLKRMSIISMGPANPNMPSMEPDPTEKVEESSIAEWRAWFSKYFCWDNCIVD